MSISFSARSYPPLSLSSVAEKIHLRGILSDLTLSNEALRRSCGVAGFLALLTPAGYSSDGWAGMVCGYSHPAKASNKDTASWLASGVSILAPDRAQ